MELHGAVEPADGDSCLPRDRETPHGDSISARAGGSLPACSVPEHLPGGQVNSQNLKLPLMPLDTKASIMHLKEIAQNSLTFMRLTKVHNEIPDKPN